MPEIASAIVLCELKLFLPKNYLLGCDSNRAR